MLLEKLQLKNFKRFKDLSLNFVSGINIIKGPNEKGKSTLVDAISTVLFEDPKSSAKKLLNHKSWQSPDRMYEISLQFSDAEKNSYLLHKDFEKKTVTIANLKTNEKFDTHEAVLNVVRANLGIANPIIFENTICVKQDMLTLLSQGERNKFELKEALEALITSGRGQVSTNEIQKKLEKEILELARGLGNMPTKNPGKIKFLQDEIAEKERIFREGSDALLEKEELTRNISSAKKKLKEISVFLQEKTELFNRNKEYFETVLKIEEIEKRLNPLIQSLEEAKILKNNLINFDEELKKFKDLDIDDLKKLEKELTRLSDKIEVREKNVKELGKILKKAKEKEFVPPRITPKENFFIIAAIFFVVGFLGFFISPLFFISFGISAVLFILPLLLRLKSIPVTKEEKNAFQDTYERLQGELKELLAMRKKIFTETGIKSEDEIEKQKDKLEDLLREKEKKEEKLKGILGNYTFSDLENEKLELSKSYGVLESKITPEQKKEPPRREDQERLEREVRGSTLETETFKKEIIKNEGRLEHIKIDQEVLIKKEEEIEALKKELARSYERFKVFSVVKEVLTLAGAATIEKSREAIMSYVNDCLGRITEGRYQRVNLDENLDISVYSNEKRAWVKPEEVLSRGTIDQIYFTVRFAFIDFLAGKKNPFLILDDPLVTFDWNRQLESLKVLEELSNKFQILFLTHSNRYDKWGNNVIALV